MEQKRRAKSDGQKYQQVGYLEPKLIKLDRLKYNMVRFQGFKTSMLQKFKDKGNVLEYDVEEFEEFKKNKVLYIKKTEEKMEMKKQIQAIDIEELDKDVYLMQDESNRDLNKKQGQQDLNYIMFQLNNQQVLSTVEFSQTDEYIERFMKKNSKGINNQIILKSYRSTLWKNLIGNPLKIKKQLFEILERRRKNKEVRSRVISIISIRYSV